MPPGAPRRQHLKIKSGPGFRLGCFGGEETQFRRASTGKSLISDRWNVKRVFSFGATGLFKNNRPACAFTIQGARGAGLQDDEDQGPGNLTLNHFSAESRFTLHRFGPKPNRNTGEGVWQPHQSGR
jgi:hypothetical protein